MRIAFLGNWQAQAIEQWVIANTAGLEVVQLPPNVDMKPAQEQGVLAIFDQCDFVFCQHIDASHPVPFVHHKFLKKRYSTRAITWPNVYFDGYFPGVQQVQTKQGAKLGGPLADQHFEFILDGFLKGQAVDDVAKFITTEAIFDLYPKPMHHSFDKISEQEYGLDVGMSDFLTMYLGNQRLFHSPNYPIEMVMREVITRLLWHAGLKQHVKHQNPLQYDLARIVLPLFPAIKQRYYIPNNESQTIFQGLDVRAGAGKVEVTQARQQYTPVELIQSFYRCYEAVRGEL